MKTAVLALIAIATAVQQDSFPNISDLKITTRRTSGVFRSIETVYFKGVRQRHDSTQLDAPNRTITTLIDCRDRRRIMLNPEARTYAAVPVETIRERIERLKRAGQPEPLPPATGPEVVTIVDAVDTGDRRQHGRYTARHVVTTITVDAAPGALTKSTSEKRDGWYLDLPDSSCSSAYGWPIATLSGYVIRPGQSAAVRDRERVEHRGRARLGFPLEEVNPPSTIELVDFSEAPLDDSVFTIPAGYRQALATPSGGFDMTKPDTWLNRVALYYVLWARWIQDWFR